MKYFISIFIVALGFGIATSCQAQGFAGKRLLVGYNFASFLDTEGNVYLARDRGYKLFPFTKIHAFEAHYIANRRTMWGLSYSGFRTDYGGSIPAENGASVYPQVYVQTLGVHVKTYLFQGGAIAPLGTYVKMGFDRHFGLVQAYEEPAILQKSVVAGGRLGAGRYSVIHQGLLLNFELETAWVMGEGKVTLDEGLSSEHLSRARIAQYIILNFKLGLAFLL